jgi:hypothetical protein
MNALLFVMDAYATAREFVFVKHPLSEARQSRHVVYSRADPGAD